MIEYQRVSTTGARMEALVRAGAKGRPKTPAELDVELESREAYSAVAVGFELGGGLAGPECYRCLTTTSKLWHQYGKLSISMCNGCVAVMDGQLCGWCGKEGEEKGRIASTCSSCRRPTHEVIHQNGIPLVCGLALQSPEYVCADIKPRSNGRRANGRCDADRIRTDCASYASSS